MRVCTGCIHLLPKNNNDGKISYVCKKDSSAVIESQLGFPRAQNCPLYSQKLVENHK